MHFHHFSLQALSKALDDRFSGDTLYNCFTQNRNELILEFGRGYWRVGCHSPLTYLVPVNEFSKARKNVVDLFPQLSRMQYLRTSVIAYERVMILHLSEGWELLFKMHGPGSNVLVRKDGQVQQIFKQQRQEDFSFEPEAGKWIDAHIQANPPLDETSVHYAIKEISPIFERKFARRLFHDMQGGKPFPEAFEQLIAEARSDQYYLIREPNRIRFYLFKPPQTEGVVAVSGIIPALQLFLRSWFQFENYRQLYSKTEKALKKPLSKLQKSHASYLKSIHQLKTDRNPEEIGHILMANLHAIEKRAKSVELDDFYLGAQIKIKLDPRLSPQENAARYYTKHKQRKGKLQYLEANLAELEDKLFHAEEQMEQFKEFVPPPQLELGSNGLNGKALKPFHQFYKNLKKSGQTSGQKRYPYRSFKFNGYDIFVGKGAHNNDELSFKLANKEDIWLHAKAVIGSHVIIRKHPGKPIPMEVIEYAAQLAAWYSKRKNDSLVAVQYTPRKYIRKRKGDPPGFVAVDREEVIMVKPEKG